MDSILFIGTDSPEWKRLKSHLIRAGFRMSGVEPSDLEHFDGDGKGRFLLGLLDASGTGDLKQLVERVRRQTVCRELPWIVLIREPQLRELGAVSGLEDFLIAPVEGGLLEARIRFILRRLNHLTPGAGIRIGALDLNVDRYEVTLEGDPLELTYKEFELFKFLATHPGRVFSRDQLLNEVWGYNFIGGTRTVDVHIRRLRAKLGPKYASLIDTVRNVGYRFLENL